MLYEDCPTTKTSNDFWRSEIEKRFPALASHQNEKFLSLKKYITDKPERFYEESAFNDFSSFLSNLKANNSDILIRSLTEVNETMDQAIKILEEINQKEIHDIHPPKDYNYKARFVQNEIHFNYLNLCESVYYNFLKIIACSNRLIRERSIEGLDLYNCWDELKSTDFRNYTLCFHNTIRNGIGHGGVYFKEREIVYQGKRGDPVEITIDQIIKHFDQMLDICNGFALAYKLFLITERNFINSNGIVRPVSFFVQELKAQANAPGWEVVDCMENVVIGNRKQLNVFVENGLLRYMEVQYFMFRTAILTEFFARGFDRYFFTLKSKYGGPGWGAFNGIILKEVREKESDDIFEYAKALEDNLIFFIPKYKIPRFLGTILSFVKIVRTNYKFHYHLSSNFRFMRKYMVRDVQIHRRRNSVVVNGTSVVLQPKFQTSSQDIIRKEYKKIVRNSIKKSKRQLDFPFSRFLKVQFAKIFVYDKDHRVRNLRSSGLIDTLVCSIEVNNSKTIKTIDILGGVVEQKGKYRIVWNSKWRGFES